MQEKKEEKKEWTEKQKSNYKTAVFYRERGKERREELSKIIKSEAKNAGVGGDKYDVIAHCRRLSPKLIKRLEGMAFGSNIRPLARLHAIDTLLDRAYGKPKETIKQEGGPRIIEIVLPREKEKKTKEESITSG